MSTTVLSKNAIEGLREHFALERGNRPDGPLTVYDDSRYSSKRIIRSFGSSETEKLFNDEIARRLPSSIQRVARRKLLLLHQARNLNDLRSPYGNRLEALVGDRAGQHSIRINDQWRLCFTWQGEDAFNVEIVDYH